MPQLDQVLAPHRCRSRCLPASVCSHWLRIPSISTDPAYAEDCRARRANGCGGELAGLGVEARCARPAAIRSCSATPKGEAKPHVLFYGHYDVQPVDPLELWETPPFEPRIVDASRRPQGHQRPRRLRRQGPGDDLRRGLPRLEGRHRRAADRHHLPGRGRGGGRLQVPARVRRGQHGRARRPTWRWSATPACGTRTRPAITSVPARHGLRGGDRALRRPRPAFRLVRRRGAQPDPRARRRSSPTCTTTTAASRSRASTTACRRRRRRCWSSGRGST